MKPNIKLRENGNVWKHYANFSNDFVRCFRISFHRELQIYLSNL